MRGSIPWGEFSRVYDNRVSTEVPFQEPGAGGPHDAPAPKSSNRWPLLALLLVALIVAGLVIFFAVRQPDDSQDAGPSPSADATASAEATPAEAASGDPMPPSEPEAATTETGIAIPPLDGKDVDAALEAGRSDCQKPGEGFVPARYVFENPRTGASVLSLGRDAEDNIAAPPGNDPYSASWWNEGPKAGSTKGKVVLSLHTYRNGGAVGNQLYNDNGPTIQSGDLIKLYGTNGEVACYEFTEATKVAVADYDPDSDIMVDFEGDPQLLMIICWDYRPGTHITDSRIFFYSKPVY